MNVLSIFKGAKGDKFSATRFIMIITCLVILLVYVAHNAVSMYHGECGFIDFPQNSVAVLFIVLGAKVGQHVTESVNKSSDKPSA